MKKLFELIKRIGILTKDKTNPFYKSKYFDINSLEEHLKPLFEEFQLLVIQPLTNVNGRPAMTTTIYDIEKSELVLSETTTLPDLQDPQKMGSAITYYRRYTLGSLLRIQAQDDDAEGTKNKPKPKTDYVAMLKKITPGKTDAEKLLKLQKTYKVKIASFNITDKEAENILRNIKQTNGNKNNK